MNVFPDIKWDFHFFLNLSNDLSVKWQNLLRKNIRKCKAKLEKSEMKKR